MIKALSRLFGGGSSRPEEIPSRNDLCWCGSGDKYKRCHMDRDLERLRRKASASRTRS